MQKKVLCAGGIVLYLDQVLLIRQNGNSWSLPKGHVDPGESLETAALREIAEESGVANVTVIAQLPAYHRFRLSLSGGDDVSEEKTITFFLCETSRPALQPQESQSQAIWVPAIGVGPLLSHPKDRQFYEQHLPMILSQIRVPVLCQVTFPDRPTADCFGEAVLQKRLGACVQLLPGIESRYHWEDKIDQATEIVMVIKTFEDRVPAIWTLLAEKHPYDVPEGVVTKMSGILPTYLEWMKKEIPKMGSKGRSPLM